MHAMLTDNNSTKQLIGHRTSKHMSGHFTVIPTIFMKFAKLKTCQYN